MSYAISRGFGPRGPEFSSYAGNFYARLCFTARSRATRSDRNTFISD
jgi:hypothetical protein